MHASILHFSGKKEGGTKKAEQAEAGQRCMAMRKYFLIAMLSFSFLGYGQEYPTNAVGPGDALYREMEQYDERLFGAFNRCQLKDFEAMFEEGVEFYHDQGGLTVGAAKVSEQVKANICGKARRELVAGSLRVYPMKGWGALLIGRHRFYTAIPGTEATGIAQFIHLVRKVEGGWKVARVISFDHMPLAASK
jgi:hypothetical protein